jgi:hypothetical protein
VASLTWAAYDDMDTTMVVMAVRVQHNGVARCAREREERMNAIDRWVLPGV